MMSNEDLIEYNELNQNSKGGTELMLRRLYDGKVPRHLLEKFQIIPSRIRKLDETKKKIFWAHDLPEDPESSLMSDPTFRRKFDKLVFVSNWQAQRYQAVRGVRPSESTVIQNSIEPFPIRQKRDASKPIRLIYHSTPHRGLDILVPVFDALWKEFPDTHLDIYSSFSLYGWPQRDAEYSGLISQINDHPAISYYGAVSNDEVRTALMNADIFAYPSIWQETGCLCLIEAMSAGLLCVHPNLAVLPETAMGLTWMYDWSEDKNQHATTFYGLLRHAIQSIMSHPDDLHETVMWQKVQADRVYNWNRRAEQWTQLLSRILGDDPSIHSPDGTEQQTSGQDPRSNASGSGTDGSEPSGT